MLASNRREVLTLTMLSHSKFLIIGSNIQSGPQNLQKAKMFSISEGCLPRKIKARILSSSGIFKVALLKILVEDNKCIVRG